MILLMMFRMVGLSTALCTKEISVIEELQVEDENCLRGGVP